MIYKAIADLLVGIHFTFILFVVLGGLLVLKRTWVALLHLPCVAWGVLIEWQGWICPLTPLEIHFRELAGGAGYPGGFIEHYLMPLIYPADLTPTLQIALGLSLLALNLVIYGYLIFYRRNQRQG
ncbi:MAG: DUF2784 domain-containing protein [Chromatiales bacterium]|jgi:hypothetical protein